MFYYLISLVVIARTYTKVLTDPLSLDVRYPRNHTVSEGGNLTLQCVVTVGHPHPNITWYNVTRNSTEIYYGAHLTLGSISRFHAGKYYCVATNGIGSAVTSKISTIDVQCK